MGADWLNREELATWVRLVAVLELLPGALDSQLRRDADLNNFEYYVLAMLSEAPERTLRMTALAAQPKPGAGAELSTAPHDPIAASTRPLVD